MSCEGGGESSSLRWDEVSESGECSSLMPSLDMGELGSVGIPGPPMPGWSLKKAKDITKRFNRQDHDEYQRKFQDLIILHSQLFPDNKFLEYKNIFRIQIREECT